jgi:hypothetical protein
MNGDLQQKTRQPKEINIALPLQIGWFLSVARLIILAVLKNLSGWFIS